MSQATILIVEDEAIVAADLAGKLKELGYEVVGTAAEGEEAVTLACRLRPQLVLMDIRLAGEIDGIEAADAIRRRHDVPVIYLTAHSDAATFARAKLTGPFGYILKPFEERELVTQIELALYKHEADRKLRELNETLEQRVAERTAVAHRRAQDLRRLAVELSEAEHRERTRLAMLLHDDLQQLLMAAKIRLPVLASADQNQTKRLIGELDEILATGLNTSRNLTQELSPSVLRRGTFTEIVEWLARWFGDKYGLVVGVNVAGVLPPATEDLRLFLYQTVRELLFNVVKHSGMMVAQIELSYQEGCLTVQVEDEGEGFDPEAVAFSLYRSNSFGLFNIHERSDALGGRMEIQRSSSGGACFRIVLPVAEDSESYVEDPELQEVRMSTVGVRKPRADGVPLRLLIVDNHAVVRESLIELFDRETDFEVVGDAADGEQTVQQAEALHPDVIITDIDMPVVDGMEAIRQIKQQWPELVVVGLYLDEQQQTARALMGAGPDTYVSKQRAATELIEAVREAFARRLIS